MTRAIDEDGSAVATETRDGELEDLCVDTIRTLSMDAVERAKSGHPGTPMALAPLAHVLFTRVMRHHPRAPGWPDRDRFILSAGHASMLLYSILHLTGYEWSLEDLEGFRQIESPCAGHPERGDAPGIEMTTGPLGQGISSSVGLALAERMLAARFNREGHEIVDHRTFVIASDGDLMEGVASEACSLAGHLGLGRLIVFYDDNHITIDGDTSLAFSEDTAARFEAYGWQVVEVGEDLRLDTLEAAAREAMAETERPSLVVVRTHIAPGAPTKQDTSAAHGAPLGEEEVRLAKESYGWPSQEPFHVPGEVRERYAACLERGAEFEAEWRERAEAYREAHPELWSEFERLVEGRLPERWDADPPRFGPDDGAVATRKASGGALQWAAGVIPQIVGGSADLGESNVTLIQGGGSVEPGDFGGRNLHFGVREHAMGAIVNGLTLHGLRGYASTFLIFSDYMRPSIRLAALMAIPSLFVFTHDSIGLGEDGPTHQPVEQLPALRAIPNLYVVRPADANETVLAWRFALAQSETPTALALSRQGLPVLDPELVPADAVERGAYVLRDGSRPEPDAVLMATGSEVHPCLAAAELLEGEGIATRVVSMPCPERFAEGDREERDSILPPACRARVAVEAASPFGWHRWVGEDGDVVAMETFGASAPAKVLFEEFGFAPEQIAERARAVLERLGERPVGGAAGPGAGEPV
ncbi:MAG: Transketolase [uncultured Solirubrobacterales bacterium]|uniref:Transketolase n=1 Tax=uncultured Solirubrobacterales bacterium TaxID=768556 RepID=A0A6J4SWE8_9ACTN|nr:MAG: Transketolase [uncultured Solirubrobacterales bacterium]